jgi:hypothetical protein
MGQWKNLPGVNVAKTLATPPERIYHKKVSVAASTRPLLVDSGLQATHLPIEERIFKNQEDGNINIAWQDTNKDGKPDLSDGYQVFNDAIVSDKNGKGSSKLEYYSPSYIFSDGKTNPRIAGEINTQMQPNGMYGQTDKYEASTSDFTTMHNLAFQYAKKYYQTTDAQRMTYQEEPLPANQF